MQFECGNSDPKGALRTVVAAVIFVVVVVVVVVVVSGVKGELIESVGCWSLFLT